MLAEKYKTPVITASCSDSFTQVPDQNTGALTAGLVLAALTAAIGSLLLPASEEKTKVLEIVYADNVYFKCSRIGDHWSFEDHVEHIKGSAFIHVNNSGVIMFEDFECSEFLMYNAGPVSAYDIMNFAAKDNLAFERAFFHRFLAYVEQALVFSEPEPEIETLLLTADEQLMRKGNYYKLISNYGLGSEQFEVSANVIPNGLTRNYVGLTLTIYGHTFYYASAYSVVDPLNAWNDQKVVPSFTLINSLCHFRDQVRIFSFDKE